MMLLGCGCCCFRAHSGKTCLQATCYRHPEMLTPCNALISAEKKNRLNWAELTWNLKRVLGPLMRSFFTISIGSNLVYTMRPPKILGIQLIAEPLLTPWHAWIHVFPSGLRNSRGHSLCPGKPGSQSAESLSPADWLESSPGLRALLDHWFQAVSFLPLAARVVRYHCYLLDLQQPAPASFTDMQSSNLFSLKNVSQSL